MTQATKLVVLPMIEEFNGVFDAMPEVKVLKYNSFNANVSKILGMPVVVLVSGIGSHNMLASMFEVLHAFPMINQALLVGYANGVSKSKSGIYEVVTTINADSFAGKLQQHIGVSPLPKHKEIINGIRILPKIESLPKAVSLSRDTLQMNRSSILILRKIAQSVSNNVHQLVDMESFSFAYVCNLLGIPARIVREVSGGEDFEKDILDWVKKPHFELSSIVEEFIGEEKEEKLI